MVSGKRCRSQARALIAGDCECYPSARMIDTFALIMSHGLLVLVVLRLLKVRDPSLPPKKAALRLKPVGRPRA